MWRSIASIGTSAYTDTDTHTDMFGNVPQRYKETFYPGGTCCGKAIVGKMCSVHLSSLLSRDPCGGSCHPTCRAPGSPRPAWRLLGNWCSWGWSAELRVLTSSSGGAHAPAPSDKHTECRFPDGGSFTQNVQIMLGQLLRGSLGCTF